MQAVNWRKIWNWHLWLGVVVLVPLVFWLGTALVFALWPIETVRGQSLSTGRHRSPAPLHAWMAPPPESLEGASVVTLREVEGHPVAVVDRERSTEVWDLIEKKQLGSTIPLAWAREAGCRDFAGPFEEEAVYLFPRSGSGRRVAGTGPEEMKLPNEYAGPLPVYGFRLRSGGMHLYVDACTGEVRARRRALWRVYDFAFALHSLEFLSDGPKRALMMGVVLTGLVLSCTGLAMALKRLRRTSKQVG